MMFSKLASLSALTLFASIGFAEQIVFPAKPDLTVDSHAHWVHDGSGFNAPKVYPINETSFITWAFDIVSEPTLSGEQPSFTAWFCGTGPNGSAPIWNFDLPSSNFVELKLIWPNGTTENWTLFAEDAIITVEGDGASANYTNTGVSFEGTPDQSQYLVEVNAPEKGIVGTMRVTSDAPAHYACGPNSDGQTCQIVPGAGWLNGVPDGIGEADLMIRGEHLEFQGRGYTDQTVGTKPFVETYSTYYWGHGRIGEYAIVWLDVLTPSGDEYVSAYVARNGEILTAACDGIQVRPHGANSTYPPTTSTGFPDGFTIEISTPEGQFELMAVYLQLQNEFDFHYRFTGTLNGTFNGERLPEGVGLWEQYTLSK